MGDLFDVGVRDFVPRQRVSYQTYDDMFVHRSQALEYLVRGFFV